MALQLGFDLIRDSFTHITIFGIHWIIASIVTLITCALIAGKHWGEYKTLILPVTIGLDVIGLQPSLIQYIIGAITITTETLSLETLGSIAETATNIASRTKENLGMITSGIHDRTTFQTLKAKAREISDASMGTRLQSTFQHKMLSGYRKDKKTGKLIPEYKTGTDDLAIQEARLLGLLGTKRAKQRIDQSLLTSKQRNALLTAELQQKANLEKKRQSDLIGQGMLANIQPTKEPQLVPHIQRYMNSLKRKLPTSGTPQDTQLPQIKERTRIPRMLKKPSPSRRKKILERPITEQFVQLPISPNVTPYNQKGKTLAERIRLEKLKEFARRKLRNKYK